MNRLPPRLLAVAISVLPLSGWAAGLPPWEFGMSKEQVKSFKQFAPYKTFSNGDLETYKGIYKGRKENVQFFFGPRGLQRIGIYIFEGKDAKKAAAAFQRAYAILQQDYGAVATPDLHKGRGIEPLTPEVIAIAAVVHAGVLGRTTTLPKRQPKGMKVKADRDGLAHCARGPDRSRSPSSSIAALVVHTRTPLDGRDAALRRPERVRRAEDAWTVAPRCTRLRTSQRDVPAFAPDPILL